MNIFKTIQAFIKRLGVRKMANLGWIFRLSEAVMRVLNVCECFPKVCDFPNVACAVRG